MDDPKPIIEMALTAWGSSVCVGYAKEADGPDMVIEALSEAGFVIVPKEPTDAMIESAVAHDLIELGDPTWPGVWKAFLAGALVEPSVCHSPKGACVNIAPEECRVRCQWPNSDMPEPSVQVKK